MQGGGGTTKKGREAQAGITQPMLCEKNARLGGYYLAGRGHSIHRHTETIALNPDHTANWALKVDLELPIAAEARCETYDDECLYLFPLAFLKKADPRTGFRVEDGDGQLIPIPTREECDWVSSIAVAEAGNRLLREAGLPPIDEDELHETLLEIPAGTPFDSSQKMTTMLELFDPDDPESATYSPLTVRRRARGKRMGRTWQQGGLTEVLRMMVEHSMVWVPLRGLPGERRSVTISQDISLERRPVLRWNFGTATKARLPWTRRRFERWQEAPELCEVLDTGDKLYGRRAYRISLPALGQRIGEPMAWIPVEYDFPTIYTKRCRTYHFELVCPGGLSPRNLKVGRGDPVEERFLKRGFDDDEDDARTTLMPRVVHHYRRPNTSATDLWFRVTVGVASGAFPILWFLAGTAIAVLLWVLAGVDPNLGKEDGGLQIVAAILLVVPAMVAALAIGGNDTPATRLIGGARMLLLIAGISAIVATAVLVDVRPFHIGHEWMWTACAIAATAATIPLATSWLLASPGVWRQLQKLNSADAQYGMLLGCIVLAQLTILVLMLVTDANLGDKPTTNLPPLRAGAGVLLLILAIWMTALANNRTAMDIGKSRGYAALSLFSSAFVCLALASIEIKTAIDDPSRLQNWFEAGAFVALFFTWYAGSVLGMALRRYRQKLDEIHVSPNVGRALIAKERVRELIILRRQEELQAESIGTAAP